VHAESEGNPLFALEIARSLALGAVPGSGTLADLMSQRLARLDERSRQVLPWAAALGRSFDPDILIRVTALPAAELLAALDEFERRGVVRSAGGTSYDFSHDLVRQAAYRQMSEPRRRLVHLQIARALAELPDPDGTLAGELAHHAGLGGDHEQAAASCLSATMHCLRLFAHAEASEVVARGLQHATRLPRERRLRLELGLLGQQVTNPLARARRGLEIGSHLSRVIVEARDAGLDADVALGLYARSILEYSAGNLAAAYESTLEASTRRRNVDPLESAVVSITQFHAGTADNIIPQTAHLRGTARSLTPETRDLVERRVREVVEGTAKLYGAKAVLTYKRDYPVTVNHERQTSFAAEVASQVVGKERVDTTAPPVMGAEDFSFMLEARPGAFIFIGNGSTAGVHHPKYDFNDKAIPAGISYWARLIETAMPA